MFAALVLRYEESTTHRLLTTDITDHHG